MFFLIAFIERAGQGLHIKTGTASISESVALVYNSAIHMDVTV